ncbi:MAG TPA: Lrp/AsnC family transcriptional regulator [Sphingobacteriaceae bacterium]
MTHCLDEVDIRILQLLQENCRLTNKEIGEKLHKSTSPIYERIKRLQEEGYIKGYIAVIDHKKIDRGLVAITHIQLLNHSEESLNDFEAQIIKFDDVLECFHMSGNYDFILKVAVKDLNAYHDFLMNKLFKLVPSGHVQSTFVMKEAKRSMGFPITIDKQNR